MKNILKDIYSNRLLATVLGFKGGTACYFFYELPRFSVDLDFDLLDNEKKEEVFKLVKKILEKYGKLSQATEKRNTLFFLLTYEVGKQKIKVEISKRQKNDNYEIKNFLGISVLTMKKEDMFANKLVAATERKMTANRDFFDINYFLNKAWDVNVEIIEDRTGKSFKEYLKFLINYVEKNITTTNVFDGLGEILNDDQKDSVRTILKRDLLFGLRNYLSLL